MLLSLLVLIVLYLGDIKDYIRIVKIEYIRLLLEKSLMPQPPNISTSAVKINSPPKKMSPLDCFFIYGSRCSTLCRRRGR